MKSQLCQPARKSNSIWYVQSAWCGNPLWVSLALNSAHPHSIFFPLAPNSHSQSWPRQEPRETRTWQIEFSQPVCVEGTRLLCLLQPSVLGPRAARQRLRREQEQLWELSTEQGWPWNRVSAAFAPERDQSQPGIWFGRQWDVAASPEPSALWEEAVGADDKGLSQLGIFCSFLLCIGFIPPYFAYLTSHLPKDLFPTAILLIFNSKQSHSCLLKPESSFMLF